MKKTLSTFLIMLLSQLIFAQIPSAEDQIAAAMQAAPDEMKGDATILGYDSEGKLITIKKGNNEIICLADNPNKEGFSAACYHNNLADFMARGRELKSQGKSRKEVEDIREKEAKSGQLKMPDKASALQILYGKSAKYNSETGKVENAQVRYVVYIPWATQESTGLPLRPVVRGGAWLMNPDTHSAHIMITPPKKD